MASFLQFGVVCYFVAIGVESCLLFSLLRKRIYTPFTAYTGLIVLRSMLMFPLLRLGNDGAYALAYKIGHIIEFGFLAWVMLDICDRWRKWRKDDQAIVTGIIVMLLPVVIFIPYPSLPKWAMFIPTYSFMAAQVVWFRGLLFSAKTSAA